MQKLDPKSVWLFFPRYAMIGAAMILLAEIFLAALAAYLIDFVDATTVEQFINNMDGVDFAVYFLGQYAVLVVISTIVAFFWAKWSYKLFRYELREEGFRKEYGIIMKRYVTIPYKRIQNIDIHRPLIARILGLSELRIQTAGSGGVARGGGMSLLSILLRGAGGYSNTGYRNTAAMRPEGYLPGIRHEVAEQMRDELAHRSRGKNEV